MKNNWPIIWDLVLKIGSISGLVALFYTITQNLRRKPKFKFDFSGSSGHAFTQDNIDYYRYSFDGDIKNQSLDPNSITKIFLVVWANKKRSSTLRFGYGNVAIIDSVVGLISLPLSFAPREVRKVKITFKFPVSGTGDKQLLSEFKPIQPGSQFVILKHEYNLAFEDVNENLFDDKGIERNRKEIDLMWTFPNAAKDFQNGKFWPLVAHIAMILIAKLKFSLKIILSNIGLWK